MSPEFDYKLVPAGFIHCLNGKCKQAKNCLRYQVTLRATAERKCFTTMNPAYIVATANDCPCFKADRMQKFALGMTRLLDKMPHADALAIKQQMISVFNRSTYYRCWRKERLISPDEQECIRKLFLDKGVKDQPVYDEYIEQYDW